MAIAGEPADPRKGCCHSTRWARRIPVATHLCENYPQERLFFHSRAKKLKSAAESAVKIRSDRVDWVALQFRAAQEIKRHFCETVLSERLCGKKDVRSDRRCILSAPVNKFRHRADFSSAAYPRTLGELRKTSDFSSSSIDASAAKRMGLDPRPGFRLVGI